MKGDFQRASQFNEFAGPGTSTRPNSRSRIPKTIHLLPVVSLAVSFLIASNSIGRVAEISGPGTNEDMKCGDCRLADEHVRSGAGLGVTPTSARSLQSSIRCAPPRSAAIAEATESTQTSSTNRRRHGMHFPAGARESTTAKSLRYESMRAALGSASRFGVFVCSTFVGSKLSHANLVRFD